MTSTSSITFLKFSREITQGGAKDYHITQAISYTDTELTNLRGLTNCIFDDKVTFNGTIFENDLIFMNCTFKAAVLFNKCQFQASITLIDCRFENDLIFNSPVFQKIALFSGKYETITFTGNVNLSSDTPTELILSRIAADEINFKVKEVNSSLTLLDCDIERIFFSSGIFNGTVSLEGEQLKFNMMAIDSCTFNERVDFRASDSGGSLNTHRTAFNQMLIFFELFRCDYISLSATIAKQRVSMSSNGNISGVSINDCDFQSSFECHKSGDSPRSTDHYFSCDISGVIRGNIIFEDIIVSSITVGCSNFGNIVFRNTETHTITIKDFLNYNKLTFANLRLVYQHHVMIIFDSNIDRTEFVNVDFRKFGELVIARSEVSNIILSNSILPPRIQIGTRDPKYGYEIPTDEKINDNTYHRENYRQLKQAMEKQGNRSAALLYKSREMHYLRKETSWGWDKILLNLNYISNNHGLSWIRGIFFTLTISLLMYIIFEISLKSSLFSFSLKYTFTQTRYAIHVGIDSFSEFLASFPLYKSQLEQADGWKAFLVIMLARIFVGYGVYQTIAAFRKYAGK
ncbi:multidrug transporter EmrE-like cation transporter [Flavobacterium sp. W4I14]|nr:multidrug transporter EmrE-like cation transporter [Flavobacterium sp. W4I14]